MAKVYKTPGVYITEQSAFSSSVVSVPTSIPAFVGYTEKATRGNKDLTNIPTRITSLSEYEALFGGKPDIRFEIKSDPKTNYTLTLDRKTRFNLYYAMRFFYANGGGPCYIVSVGKYDPEKGVEAKALNDEATMSGLPTLLKEQEPTLLVIPDAILLAQEACYSLQKAMIDHCKRMQNRFAILDVHDGFKAPGGDDNVIEKFRTGINLGDKHMQWAAAYYPWLHTNLVPSSEIDFTMISNLQDLSHILKAENEKLHAGEDQKARKDLIDKELDKIESVGQGEDEEAITTLSNSLKGVSPLYKEVLSDLSKEINLMAPSSGMAGIYTQVDNNYGVQKPPANIGIVNAISPTVNLSNEDQKDLNAPANGLSVNAIRSFVGKGLLVWGARTLDGNSRDWKYINVCRSMIMIEQSIKKALITYVFEPNNANTWASVKSMINNFLSAQWRNGVLVGTTEHEAFHVDVGLGSTMTQTDILEGIMHVTVKVAISYPAEFIVINFQQQMQG